MPKTKKVLPVAKVVKVTTSGTINLDFCIEEKKCEKRLKEILLLHFKIHDTWERAIADWLKNKAKNPEFKIPQPPKPLNLKVTTKLLHY